MKDQSSVLSAQMEHTPLWIAAERGDLAIVKLLLGANADFEAADKVCDNATCVVWFWARFCVGLMYLFTFILKYVQGVCFVEANIWGSKLMTIR